MTEAKISIPNVYVSDLEKIISKVKQTTGNENAEISFEFIIASLFPTSWKSIQSDLNRQYTKGYIQGREDERRESKE
jgi:hypothetical protein